MDAKATPPTVVPANDIFPLRHGDQLDRAEFERRYDAMPHVKKAELIAGVVHMSSPVRWNSHATPHVCAAGWLMVYQAGTPGVQAGDNGSMRLDTGNEPQPDLALIILPTHGGQARISTDDYLEGGAELVMEIAASSAGLDRTDKLQVYQRNGVREYVVWRVEQQQIDWFVLRGGVYDQVPLPASGHFCSEAFPGLWLDAEALIRGDLPRVLATLQLGIASPEHATFVHTLQGRTP